MKYYSLKYKQLDLGLFRSSLSELDKSNRWVVLGDTLPWTELEKEYNSRLQNDKKGAGNKPARMIIGAMIITHKLNLADAETIEIIKENPYMQYFCGLNEFTDMCSLVGDYCIKFTVRERCLVNAKMWTYVLVEDKPVLCMCQFFPDTVTAEEILVGTFELVSLDVIRFLE